MEEQELVEADLNASVKGVQTTSAAIPRAKAERVHGVLLTGVLKQRQEKKLRSPSTLSKLCISRSARNLQFFIRFNVLCWLIKHCSASKAFRAEDITGKGFVK